MINDKLFYTDKNGTTYCSKHKRWVSYADGRSRRCPECITLTRITHEDVVAFKRRSKLRRSDANG